MRPDKSQGLDALGRRPSVQIVGARLSGAKQDAVRNRWASRAGACCAMSDTPIIAPAAAQAIRLFLIRLSI